MCVASRRFSVDRDEFVVKPTQGSGGRGILVIARRRRTWWITSGDHEIPSPDMQYHLSAILAGLYSLGGRPDRAVIEERIKRHGALAHVAVGGTPDIRVVVYRNVPAMAMVRLPTQASRGRANLHQGAVAAGIELHTGRTTGGVCHSRVTDVHPDTLRAHHGTHHSLLERTAGGSGAPGSPIGAGLCRHRFRARREPRTHCPRSQRAPGTGHPDREPLRTAASTARDRRAARRPSTPPPCPNRVPHENSDLVAQHRRNLTGVGRQAVSAAGLPGFSAGSDVRAQQSAAIDCDRHAESRRSPADHTHCAA